MLKPPLMIMSLRRSIRIRKPSSSKRPTSPVRMKRWPCGVVPLGLARLLRLAVVAGHHAGERPTTSPGSPARQLAPLLVDQPDVVARGRLADRVQLVRVLVRVEDAGAAAFGHAVELDQAAGPALQHVGLERGGERRAGAELHAGMLAGRSCRSRAAPSAAGTAPAPAWCAWRGSFCGQLQVARRRRTWASAPPRRRRPAWGRRSPAWCCEYSGVESSVTVSGP